GDVVGVHQQAAECLARSRRREGDHDVERAAGSEALRELRWVARLAREAGALVVAEADSRDRQQTVALVLEGDDLVAAVAERDLTEGDVERSDLHERALPGLTREV